jgi:hypothetical protein
MLAELLQNLAETALLDRRQRIFLPAFSNQGKIGSPQRHGGHGEDEKEPPRHKGTKNEKTKGV